MTIEFQATELGFRAEVDGEQREFNDSDIVGIAVLSENTEDFTNGLTTVECVKLRVENHPQEFVVSVETGPHDVNLLAPFRDRVLAAALDNAWNAMKSGDEIHGQNWSLSTNGVKLHDVDRLVPLEQINGAAWYDDTFFVWQEGFDEPVLEVSATANNALILADIMGSIVDGAPKGSATSNSGPAQVLVEFNSMRRGFAFAVGGGVGLATFLAIWGTPIDELAPFLIFGPILMGGLSVALCSLLKLGHETLRCTERELVCLSNGKETVIRYDELKSMTVRWVDHYYNHRYTGTTAEMRFEAAEPERKRIKFTAKCKRQPTPDGASEALDDLQHRASSAIANRLYDQLQQDARVAWTKSLTILPDGLEVKRRTKSKFISYADIDRWSIDGGTLKIWSNERWMSQAGESTCSANFFPGWLLFISLASAHREDSIDERLMQLGV